MTTYYTKNTQFESLWDDEKLVVYIFSNNQLTIESLLSNKPKMIIAMGLTALVMFKKIRQNSDFEEDCQSD